MVSNVKATHSVEEVAFAGVEFCPSCRGFRWFWICRRDSTGWDAAAGIVQGATVYFYRCDDCRSRWQISPVDLPNSLQAVSAVPAPSRIKVLWRAMIDAVRLVFAKRNEISAFLTVLEAGFGAIRGQSDLLDAIRNALQEVIAALKADFPESDVEYISKRVSQMIFNPADQRHLRTNSSSKVPFPPGDSEFFRLDT